MLKMILSAGAIALGVLNTTHVQAENFSANLGYNSEYIFRGIPQKTSSAFAGVDWEKNGFSLGTWWADVGEGLENDWYGAYSFGTGDWSFCVGATWYNYTKEGGGYFDYDYEEINLGASWKFISFDAAIGKYDSDPKQDYQYYSITASHKGFYGKIGTFAGDFEGTHYDAGYASSLSLQDTYLFDYGIALIYSDKKLLGGESNSNLVFTISRAFSF